jgi:hypothetical protein
MSKGSLAPLSSLRKQKQFWSSGWMWILVMSLNFVLKADSIQFRPATNILCGSTNLSVGYYSIPCVTDWNGDGKKDLLVGYQTNSMIRVYTNSGTDAQPAFKNFYDLQADGTSICHPCGGCGAPAPWVCDYDGDGKRDLLVGDGADGTVYFYRNTNSDASPKLAFIKQLKLSGTNLTVGIRATPYVCDWDGDGLNDLLVGDGYGYVTFFKNINPNTTAGQLPIYAPGVRIQTGGTDLKLPGGNTARSVVRVFDWDGDGLKDLVCSSDYGLFWCRNTNSNQQPSLQAPAYLQAPATNGQLANIQTGAGSRLRLDLVDWNDDGVMDLIHGKSDGTVSYYEGYHFRPSLLPQTNHTVVLQWDSAPLLTYNVLSYDSLNGLCQDIKILPSGGKTTCWTNPVQAGQQFFRVRIATNSP